MDEGNKETIDVASPTTIELETEEAKVGVDEEKLGDDKSSATESPIQPVGEVECTQPLMRLYCPPGLEPLLETSQLVIHKENLRINQEVNESASQRLEVVDDTRRVLYIVEQLTSQDVGEDADQLKAFKYVVYNRTKQEVMSVFCPSSKTCLCCHANWHCSRCCELQAVVYCPPGVITGFVRREHTWLVQAFAVQDTQESTILRLRGALNDLGVYSADLETDLGRLAVHGWVGIMHELKRSALDWGLTFPIDLDVRMKCVLFAAALVVDWLNEKGR